MNGKALEGGVVFEARPCITMYHNSDPHDQGCELTYKLTARGVIAR